MNRLRPSLAEREAVRELLSEGYAAGRIEFEEFEARQELVGEASTIDELLSLTEGLPADSLTFAQQPANVPMARAAGLSWSRRTFLTAVAAGAGFLLAGGIGRTLAHLPSPPPDTEPERTKEQVDYFAPGAIDQAITQIHEAGYRTLTELMINPTMVRASALAPGREDVTDRVRVHDGVLEAEPNREIRDQEITFALDDIDLSLLQDYLTIAPELLGGVKVTHIIVSEWAGQLTVHVYVEGDEYGKGGGFVAWTPDGGTLLGVIR